MIDQSTQWLIQHIQQDSHGNSLWLMDENCLGLLPNVSLWPNRPAIITNRWDISEQAKQHGFTTSFSDFDLSGISDGTLAQVFYRISKEKAVTHHLINEAFRVLENGGRLWISGHKQEGIKTYIEKACVLFGCEKHIHKDGTSYSACITKLHASGALLPDDDYTHLRPCLTLDDITLYSKPGQFGWNKIDQGSAWLMDWVIAQLTPHAEAFQRSLDLGCGYGYLSIRARSLTIRERVLTDNNAAALAAARQNCAHLGINAEVVASDAGHSIPGQFDLILCNPPFHQGFTTDGDLTDKFLQSTQQLLAPGGNAYFVVNQFIPLEKKAAHLFKQVTLIAHNKSFKLVSLSNC